MSSDKSNNLKFLIESLVAEEMGEMAIRQFKTVGDWNKRSSFGSDIDRRLLTSPKAVQKIHRQWEKTPYDFDIYLVNDPRVNKSQFREVGPVEMGFVRDVMKLTPEEIPDPPPGRITVIFTGNSGDERKMASGWILAHRLGHVFARGGGPVMNEWNEFTARLQHLFAEILDQVYHITVMKRDRNDVDKILKLVAQQLGSMKSARDKNLRNWYEFAYELLAQYMLTGKITFKPLPDQLVIKLAPFGRKQTQRVQGQDVQQMYNNHDLEYYANELEQMLEHVLDRAVGKIFVM